MTVTSRLGCFALLLTTSALCGCGGGTHSAAMDAVELLDILEDDLKKHDPLEYVEVLVGKFKVTHVVRETQSTVTAKFTLYAVLPAKREEEFKGSLMQYEQRVRDGIIALVQLADTDQLLDPSLASLKEEVVAAINRVTRQRIAKDVVFSEFSLDKR